MVSAATEAHPFLQDLESRILLADGAMGTLLFDRGVSQDRCLAELNLTGKDRVQQIHLDYILAGSELLLTNTFGANRYSLEHFGLEDKVWDINVWGVKIARLSREIAGKPTWVAGSVGPLGKGLKPWGPLTTAEARSAFTEQVEALLAGGVDLFVIETMSDPDELLLAVEVVRSVCRLPVVASMTFSHEGRTRYGVSVATAVQQLFCSRQPPFDVLGVNCGAGPAPVLQSIQEIAAQVPRDSGILLAAQANAGLPKRVGRRFVYPAGPKYFAKLVSEFAGAGVRLLGGCCGTTPEHIRAMRTALDELAEPASDVTAQPARATETADRRETKARPLAVVSGAPAATPVSDGRQTPPATDTPWLNQPPLLELLRRGKVISVELDPPRGSQLDKYIGDALLVREAGVDTVNVADSPMARVRMSSLAGAVLAARATGLNPIIHFTTRDRNLMGIQSDLLGAHALGIRNVLALTGDPPGLGDYAHATAVYDVDSIGLIKILAGLNEGRDIAGNPIGKPTEFTIGAALDLNTDTPEQLENEIVRFRQKLEAGAHFVMTQPVYEPETYLNMLDRLGGIPVPVLLGVMPLHSFKHAEYLHNEVPGISVPAHVRQRLAEAGDDGQRVGLELAADVIRKTAPYVSGFYLVPSFGRFHGIASLIRELRAEWGSHDTASGQA